MPGMTHKPKHVTTPRGVCVERIEKDHGCTVLLWHDRVNPLDDYLAIIVAYLPLKPEYVVWEVNREKTADGTDCAACFQGDYVPTATEARCIWARKVANDIRHHTERVTA